MCSRVRAASGSSKGSSCPTTNIHICSAYMPASRNLVRGRITASAGGPAARAAVVTAAGIFFRFRSSGTATAAASAAAAAPLTNGRQGDEMLPFEAKAARVYAERPGWDA